MEIDAAVHDGAVAANADEWSWPWGFEGPADAAESLVAGPASAAGSPGIGERLTIYRISLIDYSLL